MFNRSTNKLTPYKQCSSNKEMWKLALELAPQIEKCTAEELADLEFGCRKEEQYAILRINHYSHGSLSDRMAN
jgi:hypothetical protein